MALANDNAREEFLASLRQLIRKTEQGVSFRGRTPAVRTMRLLLARVERKR